MVCSNTPFINCNYFSSYSINYIYATKINIHKKIADGSGATSDWQLASSNLRLATSDWRLAAGNWKCITRGREILFQISINNKASRKEALLFMDTIVRTGDHPYRLSHPLEGYRKLNKVGDYYLHRCFAVQVRHEMH